MKAREIMMEIAHDTIIVHNFCDNASNPDGIAYNRQHINNGVKTMQNNNEKETSDNKLNVKNDLLNIFEEFVEAQNDPVYKLERKIASAYCSVLKELEAAVREFWSCIRTEDDGGVLLSYYLPEYENPMLQVDEYERKLGEIQLDIENFIDTADGYTRRNLAERLHRCELDIAKEKRKVRTIKKKARLENPNLNSEEIENLEIVRAAIARQDNIIAQLKPEIDELEIKLQESKEILLKYN